jgi:uncharacterized protein YjbJ (UPF0337 family)
MEERIDEFKGGLKEGAGKMTGDTELEAEGRGEREIARARRNIKGVGDQIKGGVERGIGKLSGDKSREAEGAGTQLKGDIERAG